MKKPLHIYVHIPFCLKKCGYCDFVSYEPGLGFENVLDKYFDKLAAELEYFSETLAADRLVTTVYFGGGTPSLAGAKRSGALLKRINGAFDVAPGAETTFETNPRVLDAEGMAAFKNAGFNRVSIGVQSFSDEVLKTLGRAHDSAEGKKALENARTAGFENISADIMIGTPSLCREGFEKPVLSHLISKKIDHVSVYQFTVAEGTRVESLVNSGKLFKAPDETMADMYLECCEVLRRAGYFQYEVSNFARTRDFISRHNYSYWKREDYIGLGVSAVSTVENRRRTNTPSLEKYLGAGNFEADACAEERLTEADVLLEKIMLGLRTFEGVNVETLGYDVFEKMVTRNKKLFERLAAEKCLESETGCIKLTSSGYLIMNSIVASISKSLDD